MTKNSQQRPELEEALLSFRRAFLTVGAFSFFINLLMLTPSIYMLQVYDRALNSRNSTTLLMLTLITLGLFALMSLLEWIRSMVLVRVGARLDLAACRTFGLIPTEHAMIMAVQATEVRHVPLHCHRP